MLAIGGMSRSVDIVTLQAQKSSSSSTQKSNKITAEIYELRHEFLTAIPSLNAFHPTLPLLFSVTGSGKMHVWQDLNPSNPLQQ